MSIAVSFVLSLLFALLAVCATFFLARGLRSGRFARKLPLRRFAPAAASDLDYSYRGRDTFGFWLAAGVQIAAILACLSAIIVLVFAR